MSKWEEKTRRRLRQASPEQKLATLQHEMIVPLSTIQGVAELLKKMNLRVGEGSQEELDLLLDRLTEAASDLAETLDILMGS